MIIGIFIWTLLIGLAGLLLLAIVKGWLSDSGSNAASITAFHDMQPKDKQGAVEIVIEQKAGKRWDEQWSGEGVSNTKSEEGKSKP